MLTLTPAEDFAAKLKAFNALVQHEANHGHRHALALLAHHDIAQARQLMQRASQAQQRPR